MKAAWLLVILLVMMGCAQPLHTASGRPEVTLIAESQQRAESRVTNYFVNQGFRAAAPDRMNLRFEKEGGMLASVFFGSQFNPTTYLRLDVNVLDQGERRFRIIATPSVVSNRGSAYERQEELNGKSYEQVQTMLEDMAR